MIGVMHHKTGGKPVLGGGEAQNERLGQGVGSARSEFVGWRAKLHASNAACLGEVRSV